MEAIREIRDLDSDKLVIDIPEGFKPKRVEVIILPVDEYSKSPSEEKSKAIDQLNGLLIDLPEKKLNEFDQVIQQRIRFRQQTIQL